MKKGATIVLPSPALLLGKQTVSMRCGGCHGVDFKISLCLKNNIPTIDRLTCIKCTKPFNVDRGAMVESGKLEKLDG